jgi:hypothetical protein
MDWFDIKRKLGIRDSQTKVMRGSLYLVFAFILFYSAGVMVYTWVITQDEEW